MDKAKIAVKKFKVGDTVHFISGGWRGTKHVTRKVVKAGPKECLLDEYAPVHDSRLGSARRVGHEQLFGSFEEAKKHKIERLKAKVRAARKSLEDAREELRAVRALTPSD